MSHEDHIHFGPGQSGMTQVDRLDNIEHSRPQVLPLSARIRVTAEMSPPSNRGLAQMMYEEWVPEAERLEGAVEGLYACPQGHRSTVTRFRNPEGVRRCFFCGEVAEPAGQ